MKKMFLFSTILFAIILLAAPTQVRAQDIVDVDVLPPGNINTVIVGDTVAGGLRANPDRIYRLKRGAIYQVTEPIKVNGDLHIIATDVVGDANDPSNRPPVLAPGILADNSSVGNFFNLIGENSTVELSDLYLLAVRADQNWLGWGEGIRINAPHVYLKMRRVVMEGWSNVCISPVGQFHKVDIQDCYFRNNQHTGAWFGGQIFRGPGGVHSDTLKFINNTFFANNSYLFDVRGYDKYSVFEHNTAVYGIVNPFLIRQASNLHMKNNLFYSMHSFGGNPTHVYDGWFLNWPDTSVSSVFRVRSQDSVSYWSKLWAGTISGPEAFVDSANGVTLDMFDPTQRVSDVENNDNFYPQALWDFVDAYNDTTTIVDSISVPNFTSDGTRLPVRRTIYKPAWISSYAQWTLDSNFTGNSTLSGNMNMDPGFNSAVNDHISEVTNYIHEISTGTIDDITWHYKPGGADLYPPAWPMPEVLSYSNTALQSAGTDGFALGDLNWYPDQKNQWLTDVRKLGAELPNDFELEQNYPNPFNPTTNVRFKMATAGNVKLVVFNILGQKVKTLLNEEMKAGSYQTSWNGTDDAGRKLSSGTYLLRIQTDSFSATKKMVLLK